MKSKKGKKRSIAAFVPVLKLLMSKKTKPYVQLALMKSPEMMTLLSVCTAKTLYGKIPLSNNQKNKLKRYKKVLKLLATSKKSHKVKQHALEQHGEGIFGLLLPPLISFIAGLVGKKIGA